MKLHEVIAVEKGVKSRTYAQIGVIDKVAQKADAFTGFSKEFNPLDEDGEKFAPERKKVTARADELVAQISEHTAELFDVEATKDWGNVGAKASVIVDDKVLVSDAPVSFLLFLEKQITDLRTMLSRFVTLDENEDWSRDEQSGLFRTPVSKTHRTQKVQKALVLYPHTDKHPAQTQMITEDVLVGYWSSTKFSGALPQPQKTAILARLDKLLRAVKEARERANDTVVTPIQTGAEICAYVFNS